MPFHMTLDLLHFVGTKQVKQHLKPGTPHGLKYRRRHLRAACLRRVWFDSHVQITSSSCPTKQMCCAKCNPFLRACTNVDPRLKTYAASCCSWQVTAYPSSARSVLVNTLQVAALQRSEPPRSHVSVLQCTMASSAYLSIDRRGYCHAIHTSNA